MSETPRIDCEEALRRLAAYLDRELEPERHEEVRNHLEQCRSCFSRAEFEGRVKELLEESFRSHEVRPEFQEKIEEMVQRFGSSPDSETLES